MRKIIRVNFNTLEVRVIKRRKLKRKKVRPIKSVTVDFTNPVVVLSEIIHRMDKLEKENKRLKKENKELKNNMVTHRDIYKVANEYTESLENKVDELENEISDLKESYNYIEYLLNSTNKKKKPKKKKEEFILRDSSHESDESILFELSQTYKEYMLVNEDEMIDINWDKLEDRVGRKIKGIREEEVKWGFPILNKGQSITDDIVKGFRSEVRDAQIGARRG